MVNIRNQDSWVHKNNPKYLFDREKNEKKAGYDKFSVYFNMDNGTGRYRGIYLQENNLVRPLFEEWMEPMEDFPRRDDKNWLKWIVLSLKDGEPEFRTEPIPYESYKFEPKGFYTDNFTFSKIR